MPSPQPSRSNNYQGNLDTRLDVATWNAVLADIAARLAGMEGVTADFEGLIATGTGQALSVIEANVGPQLAALSAQVAALAAAAATAQDVVEQINSGSIPASAVAETAARIWLTPARRADWDARPTTEAVETLVDAASAAILGGAAPPGLATIVALAGAVGNDPGFAAAVATSLAARLRVDAVQGLTAPQRAHGRSNLGLPGLAEPVLASQEQAETAAVSDVLMTPLRTGQAVNALLPASIGVNGFQRLPSGLILQWGRYSGGAADATIAFPLPFPVACLTATATVHDPDATANGNSWSLAIEAIDTTSMLVRRRKSLGGVTANYECNFGWMAWGH